MNLSMIDILIILLFAIIVSMIIGFNVTRIVDKRMSEISIKVPESACPAPNILIQTEDGKIKRINMVSSKSVSSAKIEGFVGNFSNVGKNDLTRDTDGIQSTIIATDSSKPRVMLRQGYSTTPMEPNLVNRDNKIVNPDHNDILRYNGPGCYTNIDSGANKVRRVQLANAPMLQRCNNGLNIASVNTIRTKTLTASGEIVDQNVNFYIPQTYLGVADRRAGMLTGYPDIDTIATTSGMPADVDQIGSIPVNNYEGEPVPIGSILMY